MMGTKYLGMAGSRVTCREVASWPKAPGGRSVHKSYEVGGICGRRYRKTLSLHLPDYPGTVGARDWTEAGRSGAIG